VNKIQAADFLGGGLVIDLDLTYYFSAPMAGYHGNNFEYFERCVNRLRTSGVKVVSPHEIEHPSYKGILEELGHEAEWAKYLEKDLVHMIQEASGIILGKGWPESRGARLELDVSLQLARPVFFYDVAENLLLRMSKNGSML
jgi:hypothetical protein